MNIGDYVRTKRGLIGKIININEFREPCMKYGIEASYLDDIWFIGDDDIEIREEKPIDLIQVGDYVNGEKIQFITNKGQLITDGGYNLFKKYENIKSIVTKEQFENIEYKVEE